MASRTVLLVSGAGMVALGAAVAATTRALLAPAPVPAPAAAAPPSPARAAEPSATDEEPRAVRVAEPSPRRAPDELQRADILAAIERVKPRAAKCFDEFKQPGVATVKLTVASSGRVTSSKIIGALADTEEGDCVAAAAKAASFRPFKRPTVTLTWPLVLKEE